MRESISFRPQRRVRTAGQYAARGDLVLCLQVSLDGRRLGGSPAPSPAAHEAGRRANEYPGSWLWRTTLPAGTPLIAAIRVRKHHDRRDGLPRSHA